MIRCSIHLILLLVCACVFALSTSAKEEQGKDEQGRDYWVYTPDTIDPEKTYTLVLGVHGYKGNGKGAGGYAGWVKDRDVIVLGPSFDNDGYQYLGKGSDQQALDLIRQLRQQYKLGDKIFVGGFSGGAQFSHRFAMKYPDLVAGCAAHSAGTWGTGDYDKAQPNPGAKDVLFVISCGENDTANSFEGVPMNRLDWAKKYDELLKEGGYIYDAQWWAGVGHQYSAGAKQMTADCFAASTLLLPAYKSEREAIDKAMRGKDYVQAWSILRARLEDPAGEDKGIIGKVYTLYAQSLAKDVDQLDEVVARQVQRAAREQKDAQARRAVLEKMKSDYVGLVKTQKSIESALAEVK